MMRKIVSKIYLFFIFLFLYAPIFVLIVFSFNSSKSRAKLTGFSFKWYIELFQNELILKSFLNTIIIAVLAATFATVIGTIAAIGINSMKKIPKSIIVNITYLPIINPEIVTGVSLMLLFVILNKTVGIKFGFFTVFLSHITFNLPYVILNVLPKLKQVDKNLLEAAQDLGCSSFQAIRKVLLPEIMPGVISAFLISFTFSLDDFIISYFTNGSSFQTLPITIFSMTRKRVSPQINALSTILFLVVLTILIIMNIQESKSSKKNYRHN